MSVFVLSLIHILKAEDFRPANLPYGWTVVFRFGLLGKPVAGITFGTYRPAVRQISGAKLLRFHGDGIQKLIIQLGEFLRLFPAHIGDIPVSYTHLDVYKRQSLYCC